MDSTHVIDLEMRRLKKRKEEIEEDRKERRELNAFIDGILEWWKENKDQFEEKPDFVYVAEDIFEMGSDYLFEQLGIEKEV